MLPIHDSSELRYPPLVTWAVVAINTLILVHEASLGPHELEGFIARYALIPARYFASDPVGLGQTLADYLPFVTSMFLHGGWLHLILNMWMLWLFGPAVEDRIGSLGYLAFYLGCGVLAGMTHAVFNPYSLVPCVGASGAIAGVLGCYVRLFPFRRLVVIIPVLFLPFFVEVPAIVFAMLWFVSQVLGGAISAFLPISGGGIAWWAHVGGFIGGFALGSWLAAPTSPPPFAARQPSALIPHERR